MKYPLSRTKVEEVKEFQNSLHCIHKNIGSSMYSVYIPVNAPKLDITSSLDSGCSWSSIDQCQLSKTSSLTNAEHFLTPDVDLDLPLVDDVEVVPLVPLLDDDLAGHGVGGEHGVEDVAPLVLVQVAEEDVLGNCL